MRDRIQDDRRTEQLTLIKGNHRFVFYYPRGYEPSVLDAMHDMAANPESPFDLEDLSILDRQMWQKYSAKT
ncbi:MAG: hypothetical protein KJ600_01460 [Nanoarchaeota archaeon]|nr:hypothetical protein [Nanoarchaeota archaeon]MBU1103207.1 hypothetical protein [Nanoarchaeota archaeon]